MNCSKGVQIVMNDSIIILPSFPDFIVPCFQVVQTEAVTSCRSTVEPVHEA